MDLPRLLGISLTQPDKVHLTESSDPQWAQAMALLKEMDKVMTAHKAAFDKIQETAAADGSLTPVSVFLYYLFLKLLSFTYFINIYFYYSWQPST